MKRVWAKPRLLGTAFVAALTFAAVVGVPGALADYSASAGSTTAAIPVNDGPDESGSINHFYAQINVSTGTIAVADISEEDCGFSSATINWGDASSSAATLSDDGFGGSIVSGSHTYTTQGNEPVTVDATETCDSQTDTFTGGLADVGPATVTSGSTDDIAQVFNMTGTEGTATNLGHVANFHSSECNHEFGSATIDWGDGNVTSGTVVDDGFGGDYIWGSHTYADEGTYPISVTGDESSGCASEGETFTASGGTATIADAALTPTDGSTQNAVEGASMANATLGTFTDGNTSAVAGDYTVTTCWNDLGSPLPTNDCTSGSATGSGGSFSVVASHTFPEEGSFTATTTVAESDGGAAITIHTPVTVTDAALAATGVATIQAKRNMAFNGKNLANFTDADPAGTTSDYTAEVCWGDGGGPGTDCATQGTIKPNGVGGWVVVASHKYTSTGGYSVRVKVTDSGGAVSNYAFTTVRVK